MQKGPFINGTSVRVAELNSDLQQTGKNFETQVSDNQGSFEFKNLGLLLQYVELQVDGYYFNEVGGEVSESFSKLSMRLLALLTNSLFLNAVAFGIIALLL